MLKVIDITQTAPEIENSPFKFPLDPFQKFAFAAIDKHENVLVTAKTGSGKTVVGEYQIIKSLAKGKRVFYTTPIKSLSNQKFNDLKHAGYSVGIMTGDIKFAPQSDVVVMTTEILCNLLFKTGTENEQFVNLSLSNVDAVIFDEVHYINDPDRGRVWEQCLMLLPAGINLVLLSATLSNPEPFASWLGDVRGTPVHLISTNFRVVPLVHIVGTEVVMDHKDVFNPDVYRSWLRGLDADRRKQKEHQERVANRKKSGYEDAPVQRESRPQSFLHRMNEKVRELNEKDLLPALFFVFSRAKCEEFAHKTETDLLDSSDTSAVNNIIDFHLHRYPDVCASEQYHRMRSLLAKGIAFHHSGLLPILKEIVEILFARGFVKLLFATETFAVGINMPTKTVVFTSFTKHDEHGHRMLRTDEYIQMAGRAGRRGKDDRGFVMYLPDREPSSMEEVKKMMTGCQISVNSRMDFGYDFLIKTFNSHDKDWKTVAEKSYWFRQNQKIISELKDDLDKLYKSQEELKITASAVEEFEERIRLEAIKGKEGQRSLEKWKNTHFGPRWEIGWKNFKKWQTIENSICTSKNVIQETEAYDTQILSRIEFLTDHKLCDALAANVHEGHPIMTPYAFRNKLFHGLPRDQLIGCLALFAEKPAEDITLSSCTTLSAETKSKILQLQSEISVLQADEDSRRLTSVWDLSFYWIDVAVRWLNGDNSRTICADYELYEGNFIRAMLKISNLADEWIVMATISEDLEQLELLREIRTQLVRDVVVPDSLYLRI